MKEIYVSSQDFGFGPTSNLFAIVKYLKSRSDKFKIYAIKNEPIEIFSQINAGLIDKLDKHLNYKRVDLVLSSFDPFSIFESWLHNIPNIFYCNLFWYWDIYNNFSSLEQHKNNLEYYKNNYKTKLAKKYFLEIFKKNPHEAIFMGFLLADKCFTRKFPNIEYYLNKCASVANITLADIYIPYQLSGSVFAKKKKIFFQLSGGRNPIVSFEENAIYANLCIKLTQYLAKNFCELEFIICINPAILKHIKPTLCKLYSNVSIISSVSQYKNLSIMESALAIFTSPGLETIYESIYAHCPAFLLPEQNGGQYSIFTMLSLSGYKPERYLINEEFKNRDRLPGEEDAHAIYQIIKDNILSCDKEMIKLLDRARSFIHKMTDKNERIKYLNMSLTSIKLENSHSPFTQIEPVSNYIIQQYA